MSKVPDTRKMTLDQLGLYFGSDKASTWHDYLPTYEQYLLPYRKQSVRLLEIGVQGGASLKMWHEYLPSAAVIGLDIKEDCWHPGPGNFPRVVIQHGDQSDQSCLAQVQRQGPFHIVIDDGSHVSRDQIMSFSFLFRKLLPGGIYVIEDINSSFWRGFANVGNTLVEFLCGRVVQWQKHVSRTWKAGGERVEREPIPDYCKDIDSVHWYDRIVFIRKKGSSDGGQRAA